MVMSENFFVVPSSTSCIISVILQSLPIIISAIHVLLYYVFASSLYHVVSEKKYSTKFEGHYNGLHI